MGRSQVFVAIAAGLVMLAPPTAAQEATPASGLPVTPDPAECTVAPRPLDDFAGLVGTPVPAPLERFERPRGEPADAEILLMAGTGARSLAVARHELHSTDSPLLSDPARHYLGGNSRSWAPASAG